MLGDYATEEEALRSIATRIPDAYRENYAEVFEARRVDIDQAVVATQHQFTQNMFPEMKVKWDGYPDNIGHFIFPGCMRCHNGKMKSEEGWVITRECTSCHIIIKQGSGDRLQMAMSENGLEFDHPDGGDDWRDTDCYECHTGTQP
jgi:hypothetical protein